MKHSTTRYIVFGIGLLVIALIMFVGGSIYETDTDNLSKPLESVVNNISKGWILTIQAIAFFGIGFFIGGIVKYKIFDEK